MKKLRSLQLNEQGNIIRIDGHNIQGDGSESSWELAIKEHIAYDSENEIIDADDLLADNLFATEELELGDGADFGTNAKEKIGNVVDSKNLVTQTDLQQGLATRQVAGDYVSSTTITAIVKLTQAEYDALPTKFATTMYVIVG